LDSGANDVFLTPVIMKKGRPGTKVSIISEANIVKQMEDILFTETTTIGIRKFAVERTILDRTSEIIDTRYGPVRIKKVLFNGKEMIRPEYEECKKIALENNLSIQQIYREIESLNK
jgi:uncharacterized protein (DUF111 family)